MLPLTLKLDITLPLALVSRSPPSQRQRKFPISFCHPFPEEKLVSFLCLPFCTSFFITTVHVLTIRRDHVILVKICFMLVLFLYHSDRTIFTNLLVITIRCSVVIIFFSAVVEPRTAYCCVLFCARCTLIYLLIIWRSERARKKGTVFLTTTHLCGEPKSAPRNTVKERLQGEQKKRGAQMKNKHNFFISQ